MSFVFFAIYMLQLVIHSRTFSKTVLVSMLSHKASCIICFVRRNVRLSSSSLSLHLTNFADSPEIIVV
uniref:Putative secreted protein n=1 Tax=Panstrongylus lignarius TaxID=156445 RepID=A0A224XV15_9HEMI